MIALKIAVPPAVIGAVAVVAVATLAHPSDGKAPTMPAVIATAPTSGSGSMAVSHSEFFFVDDQVLDGTYDTRHWRFLYTTV
jgi:hypothetical protein